MLFLILNLSIFLSTANSSAQVLSAFVREQAGTLPQGRFLTSMVWINSSIDTNYGQDGIKRSLSQNLNQSISFQKIASDEKVRGNQLSGLFQANGVTLSDSAGTLSGSISGEIRGKVPVLGYGITDSLGVYLSIPIIEFNIRSSYQFTPSSSTQSFFQSLVSTDQVSVKNDFKKLWIPVLKTNSTNRATSGTRA